MRAAGTLLLAAALFAACVGASDLLDDTHTGAQRYEQDSAAAAPEESTMSSGAAVYAEHCAVCHGSSGRGDGDAARRLAARPRDFVKAEYRFRSTGSGKLPTDGDLRRAIVNGLAGTAMVPQNHLSDAEVSAVLDYIKSLSPRFAEEPAARPLRLPAPIPRSVASRQRGREVFFEAGCDGCHGEEGKGDGRNAADLSMPPTDLTRHPLKGGSTAADILRSVVTGLNGTPMPSYHLLFDAADMWALAYYVESLGVTGDLTEQARLGWGIEKRTPPE